MSLLPPQQKKRIRLLVSLQNINFSGGVLLLLVLFLILILGGFLFFLNLKYYHLEEKIVVEQNKIIQAETVESMNRKVSQINKELKNIRRIQKEKEGAYQTLDIISKEILVDLEVYTLEINQETGKVSISGHIDERDKLLTIKEKLEISSKYQNINFPLSNISAPRDIDFYLSFTFSPEKNN